MVAKPSGLLSVPGRGPHLADCLLARVQAVFPEALLVHRLDHDTSGVMVFALSPHAQRHLGLQFEKRQVKKTYVARVWGSMAEDAGTVDLPLIVDWPNRPRQKVDFEAGQEPGAAYWRGRRAATITTGGAAVGWIGETPVIVGSGPSLKTVEIERLGTRQCMLLNGALSLVDKIGSNHIGVIEDERFVWRHSELIATSPVTRWLMSAGVIRTVLTRDASWFERCEVALIDNLEKPFDARRRALDGLGGVIADKWAHYSTRPDLGCVFRGIRPPLFSGFEA